MKGEGSRPPLSRPKDPESLRGFEGREGGGGDIYRRGRGADLGHATSVRPEECAARLRQLI